MKVDDKSAEIERLKERGQAIAWTLDSALNPEMTGPQDTDHRTTGFVLFIFPFGEDVSATSISNADRASMIRAVEAWLKHAKRRT